MELNYSDIPPDYSSDQTPTTQSEKAVLPTSAISSRLLSNTVLLYQTFGSLILLLGTFGNLMIIAVLRRSRPPLGSSKSSYNLLVVALAVSDLFGLYGGFFGFWWEAFSGYSIHKLECKLRVFFSYVAGFLSSWILVAMTTHRAITVVWPHRARSLCTRARCRTFLISLVLLSAALNAHIAYGHDLNYFINDTGAGCFPVTPEYIRFYESVWSWCELGIFSFLPFLLIATNNVILVQRTVWYLRVVRLNMSACGSTQMNLRSRKTLSMGIALIAVSFVFFVCCVPSNVYQIIRPSRKRNIIGETFDRFLFSVLETLWYTNNCVNFYIYCLMGSKFRSEFNKIVRCCRAAS